MIMRLFLLFDFRRGQLSCLNLLVSFSFSFSDDLRCVIDLALIADSSGSIGRTNFFQLKLFLKNITRLVNMGPQGTHIALVFFSTRAKIVSDFAEFVETPFNKDNIRRKIDKARHQRGFTLINRALRAAEEQVFRTEFGMRPHVKKVFWGKRTLGVLGILVCVVI